MIGHCGGKTDAYQDDELEDDDDEDKSVGERLKAVQGKWDSFKQIGCMQVFPSEVYYTPLVWILCQNAISELPSCFGEKFNIDLI